jgi:hypothetical protein
MRTSETMPSFVASHDALKAEAVSQSGLDDFGTEDFVEGYKRLLEGLDGAGLSAQGTIMAREIIVAQFVARLQAIDGFKRFPEALTRPIRRPLVITGIARSGTTALHKLLSMDPQFQGPEHWLCAAPQPRPPRAEWPNNPNFQQAKAALDAMIAVAPEVLDDHGMAIDGVEESLNVLSTSFCSNMWPSSFVIPDYDTWYRATDDTFAYRFFAKVLQLIGANETDRTWLIKNPTDTYSMQQVLNVFPDAMIVQTHRDPLQSIPSLCNLLRGAHRAFRGDGMEPDKIYAREEEFWAVAMDRAEAVKATIPGQFIDVEFRDFVRDQMGVVRGIYDQFGFTLSLEAERAMNGWLAANPRRSTTMQRFTPEYFGGSTEQLLDRFAAYRRVRGYRD